MSILDNKLKEIFKQVDKNFDSEVVLHKKTDEAKMKACQSAISLLESAKKSIEKQIDKYWTKVHNIKKLRVAQKSIDDKLKELNSK